MMNIFPRAKVSLFKGFLPIYKISIKPNESHMIRICLPPADNTPFSPSVFIIAEEDKTTCKCLKSNLTKLDSEIICDSIEILKRKLITKTIEIGSMEIRNRLETNEKLLKTIIDRLPTK